jgi:hypothetical protein
VSYTPNIIWIWVWKTIISSYKHLLPFKIHNLASICITFPLLSNRNISGERSQNVPRDLLTSPYITSWSPQGMRVLRQCKAPRAEIKSVTIQRENFRPLKKEMNKAWTCPMFAVSMNHYVSLSLTSRKSSVHLHTLYSPHTALRTFTSRRDQLVICGQYVATVVLERPKQRCMPVSFSTKHIHTRIILEETCTNWFWLLTSRQLCYLSGFSWVFNVAITYR